jgi:alkylation response protein AidB-like acyl-CoA dehydrogenase
MFELTKSQKEIQKAAKDFAKGEFDKDLAYQLEIKGEFPREIWQKAAELGFIGIHFPEEYSGGGLGVLENVITIEELCRNDPSLGSALAQATSAAECLLRFGSESLKALFLPRVASGEILSGKAFTENDRGGDYSSIAMTARQEGDQWILDGIKKHVVNGGQAGFYVVVCKTGQDEEPLNRRLSMFLVEADRAGIASKPYGKRLGNNLVGSSELTFVKVVIPGSNIIGSIGQGFRQMQGFLDMERVIIAAQALGTALASFDRMLAYVKGREQFGKKIAEFQVSRHKIADMATQIELSRLVIHKAAWNLDHKKQDSALCSMAKMTATRTAMAVGAQTIQLFGGYGYMTEYEVERFYRDAKTMEIREGTRDLQKDIIANAVIGKIK